MDRIHRAGSAHRRAGAAAAGVSAELLQHRARRGTGRGIGDLPGRPRDRHRGRSHTRRAAGPHPNPVRRAARLARGRARSALRARLANLHRLQARRFGDGDRRGGAGALFRLLHLRHRPSRLGRRSAARLSRPHEGAGALSSRNRDRLDVRAVAAGDRRRAASRPAGHGRASDGLGAHHHAAAAAHPRAGADARARAAPRTKNHAPRSLRRYRAEPRARHRLDRGSCDRRIAGRFGQPVRVLRPGEARIHE